LQQKKIKHQEIIQVESTWYKKLNDTLNSDFTLLQEINRNKLSNTNL